ncbi:hypothetical protein CAPTEDRAFT_212570 [Capitella teleta]|uniref:G-protein coupled receptors family 1 profile domain-containing protein n=1 Tax=Capitella teleta TaxID=283909 RepID=R7V1M2_CAPTE|nr:hypothetical protein CAPTEDRAFT_212570 [Capitella teleta]|eukprot:ELU09556.1 hypothetical protein CAPTEDRAFT_212570 [Capitella teleta]
MANYSNGSMTSGCQVDYEEIGMIEHFRDEFANHTALGESRRVKSAIEGLGYVTSVLCMLGIVGNILNILVLSQKGLLGSMERMERSAHFGLLSLALSDLLFCILLVPRIWIPVADEYYAKDFSLFYATYSDGFINIFLLSSTWLTVTMATSRYLAICFPLQARQVIGMTFAKLSIIVVFVICILFNIPKFFTWRIVEGHDIYCRNIYQKKSGPLLNNALFASTYRWSYFVLGILIPLIVLAYCNVNLVRALRRSLRMQKSLRATRTRAVHTTNRITLIFIIIIVLYLLMVLPGELVHFIRATALESDFGHFHFNLAVAVTNTCQAVNFAVNFVLYLTVNIHFRSQFCALVHCTYLRGKPNGRDGNGAGSTRHPNSTYTRQMELSTTEQLLEVNVGNSTDGNATTADTSFSRLNGSPSMRSYKRENGGGIPAAT